MRYIKMKYINFILIASLTFGSFSVHAEKKQDLTKKNLMNVRRAKKGLTINIGPALKKTGRVAKTGAYGLLTGVSFIGALTALCFMGSFASVYFEEKSRLKTRQNDLSRASRSSRDSNGELAKITETLKAHNRKGPLLALAAIGLGLSTGGLGWLTVYFARKTKQAVQEPRAPQNSKKA
jgi:hypothetical protein